MRAAYLHSVHSRNLDRAMNVACLKDKNALQRIIHTFVSRVRNMHSAGCAQVSLATVSNKYADRHSEGVVRDSDLVAFVGGVPFCARQRTGIQ